MEVFPTLEQLINFFGSKPKTPGPADEWYYSTLGFSINNALETIECDIEPSEYIFRLRYYNEGFESLNLNFETVDAIEILSREKINVLRVNFYYESRPASLELQLEPFTRITVLGY